MSKKTISFELSSSGITLAIKELEEYKRGVVRKTELLRKKVAERMEYLASSGFNGAIVDDLTENSGGKRYAQVDTSIDERGNLTVVIAHGEDAVWVEFGAGVYHNGSAGSSPHPKGSELGFTIGDYGYGKGKKSSWGFYEKGDLKITHGTPAVMPMYNAVKVVCDEIASIAKEVFG